jgi:hypothetical protein
MAIRLRMDQLSRDPHTVAGALDGSFDNRIHVQRLRDFRQGPARALVRTRRCAT